MSIELKTIKDVIKFLDDLDGCGIVFEHEDLIVERLINNYIIKDNYTPEKRKEYIEYLSDHEQLNDVFIMLQTQYGKESLEDLDYLDLKDLAEEWGY